MTVSTEVSREEYTGNGVTTDFDYRFRVFSAEDLVVSVADTTETITVLTLNTDYTVTGAGSRTGGKVKLLSPLVFNWRINIERALPVTQETDIRNQGNFFPEVHEDAFDKLTMLIQQVWSYFGLALRKPTWLAKYYDAQGNRIANLGNPINPQDAATKSYVDAGDASSNDYADNLFKRTLRVPESQVTQLPPVAARRNKLNAWNNDGQPIVVLPESGSAADVMIQLASSEPGLGSDLVYGAGRRFLSTAELRAFEPTIPGYVATISGIRGQGQFKHDPSDAVSSDDNGYTTVVTPSGARYKRVIGTGLLASWSGVDLTGATDVTISLQTMIHNAEKYSVTSNGVTTKAIVYIDGHVKISSTITMDPSRVAIHGPGTIYIDPTGSYPSGYAFILTSAIDTPLASYTNKTTPAFRDLMFASDGRSVNLFFGVNNTGDANNNPAALQSVFNCHFKGFRTIYSNGTGGWGWSWHASGCNSCDHWMNITAQPDTYERFSFDSCIFQNGGYAFLIDNPDGKIYWHKGSMDYCEGAAIITRGFIEINSHIEFSARTLPFIDFRGANAHAVVSGLAAIRLNTTTKYNIFKQYVANQVTLKDIDIISDGINISSCVISNLPYLKTNVNFTNDAAKAIALYDADGSLVSPGISSVEYVVTGTGLTSVINGDGSITLTSSVNAGGSKGLDFFVPITGHTQVGVEWFGSNTSTLSPVFLQKLICNQVARSSGNGVSSDIGLITDKSVNGTTSIGMGAVNVRGSSGTLWATPKSAFYLRLRFNADNIGMGEKFTIHSLKLISC